MKSATLAREFDIDLDIEFKEDARREELYLLDIPIFSYEKYEYDAKNNGFMYYNVGFKINELDKYNAFNVYIGNDFGYIKIFNKANKCVKCFELIEIKEFREKLRRQLGGSFVNKEYLCKIRRGEEKKSVVIKAVGDMEAYEELFKYLDTLEDGKGWKVDSVNIINS